MKTFAASAIAILFAGFWTTAASAADPIGAAVRVVNNVTAEADQSVHPVAQGDGVRQNETIEVAADSLGELRLNDQTKVALGPNSKLKLDKFVYDPDKATGTIAVDLAKGAFRFITGAAKKSSYIIRSPNAAITVRGTVFDVYVDANGTMWVLLHEGSIDVCNSAGQCKAVRNSCGLVRVGPGGVLSEAATWNKQPEVSEIAFEVAFPFVVNPPEFDPEPRFTRASIETGTCNSQDLQPPKLRRAEALPPTNYSSAPASTPPQPIQQAQASSASSEPVPASDSLVPSEPLIGRSWSGPYIGVSMGGGWGGGNTSVNCDDPTGSFDTVRNTPNCAYPIAIGALETQYDTNPSGFIGGAAGGYNVQLGNFVWGVEADVSVSSIDGSDTQSREIGRAHV